MFQKVNDWLTERGERFARSGDTNRTPNNAYYASTGAEQAYGGAQRSPADAMANNSQTAGDMTGRTLAQERVGGDSDDKYGGRVPYRSQKDIQAEMDAQRQQAEEQTRRQQTANQQRQAQQFGRTPQQMQQPMYQQPQQAHGNILPFPGMVRGPEGNMYAHMEYVVLLRSRNECTKVIEYIKANASVFLNMEFIANDSERQRCVDMLSGAAYTLGCQLSKISPRGIYLISSPSVCVVMDPAMQKFASSPESQGYVRPDYNHYAGYNQQAAGYGATQGGYNAQASRVGGYAAQSDSPTAARAQAPTYENRQASPAATGYAAQQAGYSAGAQTAAYQTQPAAYGAGTQTRAAYPAQQQAMQTAAYAAAPGVQTTGYAAQNPQATAGYAAVQGMPRTGDFNAQQGNRFASAAPGAQISAYPQQQTAQFSAQPQSMQQGGTQGGYASQPQSLQNNSQPRRMGTAFGMQGPFVKSAEGGAGR